MLQAAVSAASVCWPLLAAVVLLWALASGQTATANEVEYILVAPVSSSTLQTSTGEIRASLVVGEAGPVGLSHSNPPGITAQFGALRVLPVPEPGIEIQTLVAIATLAFWRAGTRRRERLGMEVNAERPSRRAQRESTSQ